MDDSVILRAALDKGWISPAQVTDALKAGAAGETAGFADLLVGRGWLDRERARSLLASSGPRAGRFVLLRELGKGGMGTVFEAWDPQLRRRVAVKVLEDSLAHEEDVARFYREAQTAGALKHAGIVRVHEIGRDRERPFIVMDLLDGGTLAGRKLRPREAAQTLAAVARAVEAAHRAGIIHRDLKPQNILLDDEGRPCVADFGLAKRVAGSSKLTATGFVVGTPSYMAPEQARGLTSQIDARADVYSLGAVLFELLTGRPAVQGATVLDTLRRAAHEEVRAPSSVLSTVPRELDAITLTAMAKDRLRRYPTAAALADDLERYLAGRPIQARVPFRWPALLRRHPALTGVVSAVPVTSLLLWILLSPAPAPPAPPPPAPKPAVAKSDPHARAQPDYDAGLRLLESCRIDYYRADADLGRTRSRLNEAIVHFGVALALHPGFGEAVLARGHAWALLRRPENADVDYSAAVLLLPGSAEARLARGLLTLRRISDYLMVAGWRREQLPQALRASLREADVDLLRARELGLEKNATRFLEAAMAYGAADFAGALVLLDTLSDAEGILKEDVLRLRAKARSELAASSRIEAERQRLIAAGIEDLGAVIGLRVNDAEARRYRGSLYFLCGRMEEARADFERVLKADPTHSEALSDLATFHHRSGHPELALPMLDRSIDSDPSNMRARSLRAVIRMDGGRFAEARSDLEKAVAANPDYLPALLNLALCLGKLGEVEECLRRLDAILERNPDMPVALYSRGCIYYSRERWKDALRDLERAGAVAPAQYAAQVREPVLECRRRLGR
jgi:tetratricopeptide (TPR) repeat protein